MITRAQHLQFFDLEITTQLREWDHYLNQKFNNLLNSKKKELFVGRIISIKSDGCILIRCKKGSFPRFNWQYYFKLIGPDVKGDPNTWDFTFKEYKESEKPKYSLNAGSNGVVTNFSKADQEFAYFNAIIEDNKFLDFLEFQLLKHGKQPLITISKSYPPIDYFKNLKAFVEKSNNYILTYTREVNRWNPINLQNIEINENYLIDKLLTDKLIVIQGPPGTGKSYQAANISKKFIIQNKSVAICALTNRALIEIASQPALKDLLPEGKVYKTNCSRSEAKELPGLLDTSEIKVIGGKAILTTYYKFSSFNDLQENAPCFDLLIIEEASQAFLATLALFSGFAKHVLIIGDQMQLPPVVQSRKEELAEIHNKIFDLIEGFDTLTWNITSNQTYRFAQTRRLTEASAYLTGLFYDNKLQSCSPLNNQGFNSGELEAIFGKNGGVSIAKLPFLSAAPKTVNDAIQIITTLISKIKQYAPEASISILTFKVSYEQKLIERIEQHSNSTNSILVSTVHRVQGITTDYTLYLMPLEEVDFELNPNLFNVATSRARKGTLLITFEFIENMDLNPTVKKFLGLCNDVTSFILSIKS